MKLLITVILALLAIASSVLGQGSTQVNYSAAPGQRSVHTFDGNPVVNGNSVWIGTFAPGFDPDVNGDNPAQLLANWIHFGSTAISTIFGQPGRFTGTSSSTDPVFFGDKIYLWIFSTDGATAPEADFNNVNEYGLYSASLANWTFSPDPAPNNVRNINSNEVNEFLMGGFAPGRLTLAAFNPVPEPSTLALLGVAIPTLVLALRKRR